MKEKKINFKKHLFIFITALFIFVSGFILSDQLFQKKLNKLMEIQENLRIDILSSETQFSILNQVSCENLDESILSQELYEISKKLNSIGGSLGEENPDFLRLKKFYSILEIKHWLLLQKASQDCDLDITSIIYFYDKKKDCPKCSDQGYLLSYFRKKYPFLRTYSFDYQLDLAPIQTLKSIYNLKKELPIIIVNNDVYYGFKTKGELEEIIGKYVDLEESTTTESGFY